MGIEKKTLTDQELIVAAQNNNQEAFDIILKRYHDQIFFMILKMVRNRSDAEDITIEAFSKAFLKINQYSPDFAFSTWLYRIASNNAVDFIRKRKLDTTSIDEQNEDRAGIDHSQIMRTDDLNPEETVIKEQKAIEIRDLVDKIKPQYSTLIKERYFNELSYEEISQKLDIPIGTVKVQLHRAKNLLLRLIKEQE